MRSRFDPQTLLTVLAAAALMALGGPGVSVAEAGAPERRIPLQLPGDEHSCRAPEAGDVQRRLNSHEAMERLQAQLRAQLEGEEGDEIVVLNNRGYNYDRNDRRDPAAELQILRRDAARQRSEAAR